MYGYELWLKIKDKEEDSAAEQMSSIKVVWLFLEGWFQHQFYDLSCWNGASSFGVVISKSLCTWVFLVPFLCPFWKAHKPKGSQRS